MRTKVHLSLLLLSAVLVSCTLLRTGHQRQFVFHKGDREQKMLFRLPAGKYEENFRVGDLNAKEQFYYFNDGAVFYVARLTTWQTVNKHRIDKLDTPERRGSYAGTDKDGLHWKEISLEEFRIGYAYVSNDKLESYNRALNSVRIR